MAEHTTCTECGRVVMVDHVDAKGRCALHQPAPKSTARAAKAPQPVAEPAEVEAEEGDTD